MRNSEALKRATAGNMANAPTHELQMQYTINAICFVVATVAILLVVVDRIVVLVSGESQQLIPGTV